jgi:hypothetical protein
MVSLTPVTGRECRIVDEWIEAGWYWQAKCQDCHVLCYKIYGTWRW